VPYKGSLPSAVPTDPLIYRWYEIVSVYGTTIKELIHEEFGDGIMSAIDFSMDIQREADPKGDRVQVVLSGKFLPTKATRNQPAATGTALLLLRIEDGDVAKVGVSRRH
jgi:cyanate lyase